MQTRAAHRTTRSSCSLARVWGGWRLDCRLVGEAGKRATARVVCLADDGREIGWSGFIFLLTFYAHDFFRQRLDVVDGPREKGSKGSQVVVPLDPCLYDLPL